MCQVPPENHRRPGSLQFPAFSFPSTSFMLIFLFLPLQIENSFSLSVPIFKQFHKNIIGKGGANIKKVGFRVFQLSYVCNVDAVFKGR